MRRALIVAAAFAVLGCGGSDPVQQAAKPKPQEPENKIFDIAPNKIGKFDPNAKGQKISDAEFKYEDPLTGPIAAYGAAMERIHVPYVNREVETFRAINGRYPKDYKEFMEEIIRKPGIKLPPLKSNKRWAYDEKNHQLVVVEKSDGEEEVKDGKDKGAKDQGGKKKKS